MEKQVLAFDFGASSGRAMLGTLRDGSLSMQEIHRFSNDPVSVHGTLYWDVLRLFHEIRAGISKAVQLGGFDSIGIDTWGVDFGLLDQDGRLLENPVHYRDLRTSGMPPLVFDRISRPEIYRIAGIQYMRINTLYQLMYLSQCRPELLRQARQLLFLPDLFAYFLTGERRCEITIASTSNLLDAKEKTISPRLLEAVSVPEELFPPVIRPGEAYGTLSAELCEELGCKPVPVIAVCTHDTASAVVSVPASDPDFAYISSGTWSLFGTELSAPVLTPEAEASNFTNETGFGGTTRFLKNIMGLWVIQESRRQWLREGAQCGYDTLEQEALQAEPFRCYIDIDAPEFETPGNLPKRIRAFCERTGQFVPQTRGEVMRCIYQSLAMKYRRTFDSLRRLTGREFTHLHVIGGGIKDTLLCRMTAQACGVPVLAGPAEATAMGNVAVQLIAAGELKDLSDARAVIRHSVQPAEYLPSQTEAWNTAYQTYEAILQKEEQQS